MTDFCLSPSGPRARQLDRRMRSLLGESFDYIANQIGGSIPCDMAGLRTLAHNLRDGGRYPPSTFGLYADLVSSIAGGDYDEAERLLAALVREAPVDARGELLPLDTPALAPHAERYVRFMDSDPETSFRMLPPPANQVADFHRRYARARELMVAALPELVEEFEALVNQIILVTGDKHHQYQFDGGSAYMLWGGLFLNAESHESDVALIEVLAHESGHLLLFGFSADEALVENEDTELYPSPLRLDPRPMDGIFHATYVSARMHWVMSRLLDSGRLTDRQQEAAAAARESDARNFRDGYAVVARHGRLSPTGNAVMEAAREYMERAAGPVPLSR